MDFKQLNRPKGANRYCGPAAISFLTGLHTDDAAAMIRRHSGQRAVRGSNVVHVLRVLAECGLNATPLAQYVTGKGPTLAGWLHSYAEARTSGRMFLVCAGNHFQLISGRRYACGRIGEVVSIRDKRVKRRCRVRQVFEIAGTVKEPTHVLSYLAEEAADRREKTQRNANARRRLRELEAAGIIEIDDSDFRSLRHIYVQPGRVFEKDEETGDMVGDPFDGAHIVHDWEEAVGNAEEYARLYSEQAKVAT